MVTNAIDICNCILSPNPTLQLDSIHSLGYYNAHRELEEIVSALESDTAWRHKGTSKLTIPLVLELIAATHRHLERIEACPASACNELLDKARDVWCAALFWMISNWDEVLLQAISELRAEIRGLHKRFNSTPKESKTDSGFLFTFLGDYQRVFGSLRFPRAAGGTA